MACTFSVNAVEHGMYLIRREELVAHEASHGLKKLDLRDVPAPIHIPLAEESCRLELLLGIRLPQLLEVFARRRGRAKNLAELCEAQFSTLINVPPARIRGTHMSRD